MKFKINMKVYVLFLNLGVLIKRGKSREKFSVLYSKIFEDLKKKAYFSLPNYTYYEH